MFGQNTLLNFFLKWEFWFIKHEEAKDFGFCFSLVSKLDFSFLSLRKTGEDRHQFESQLAQLWFPQALLRKNFSPHPGCSVNQLHQEPWESRGSFAMILWGFGPEEEIRNFKSFDILCIILSPFNRKFKKKKKRLFRRNFSQIPSTECSMVTS